MLRYGARWVALAALVAGGCDRAKPLPNPVPANPFDGERAYRRLVELCMMGPRNHGSDVKEKAEDWIQAKLKEAGAAVEVHAFEHTARGATGPSRFRNIVGRFRPEMTQRVMLGTHYDTRSWADKDPRVEDRVYPIVGANDGGSGVVVLLELALCWKDRPPPVGVDLIFFDGEDFGREGIWEDYFLGSKAWVRDHPQYKVEWGVIVDMVGDSRLAIRREGLSREKARAVVDRVWAAAKRAGAAAFLEEDQSTMMDDHNAFLNAGIPVVLLIDFEYPYFHTGDDTPEQCSAASLGQVGRTLYEAVSAP